MAETGNGSDPKAAVYLYCCHPGLHLSLNSMGPTPKPTQTLGMRLSCNFVNVYTIVYHVQYTYTCTRAHPQLCDILVRKSARDGQKSVDKSARIVVRVRLVAS